MTRIACAAMIVMMMAAGVYAEQKEQTAQKAQDQPPGQQMQMDCPMMGGQGMMGGGMKQDMKAGMMEHHMMMHDSTEIMMGILAIQEKILTGAGPGEKEALLKEIARLKSRLEQMHHACCRMMGMGQQPTDRGAQPQAPPQQHVH